VARQIIQEQVLAGGDALAWGDREKYTRLVLDSAVAEYLENGTDRNFKRMPKVFTPSTVSCSGCTDHDGFQGASADILCFRHRVAVDLGQEYKKAILSSAQVRTQRTNNLAIDSRLTWECSPA
jgi:hypothetical protein